MAEQYIVQLKQAEEVIVVGGTPITEREKPVNVISFSAENLTNGDLIQLHNLNRRVVNVTVTNPQGIEFNPRINNLNDNTRVLIDLKRYQILPGETWSLIIQ